MKRNPSSTSALLKNFCFSGQHLLASKMLANSDCNDGHANMHRFTETDQDCVHSLRQYALTILRPGVDLIQLERPAATSACSS